jgi:hypothetical protein
MGAFSLYDFFTEPGFPEDFFFTAGKAAVHDIRGKMNAIMRCHSMIRSVLIIDEEI